MRMFESRALLATGLALLLLGCTDDGPAVDQPPPGPQPIVADFACGEDIVQAGFQPERMVLVLGQKRYELDRARSGSGARYTGDSPDGPVEFWNKGRDARLTIGSRTFPECRQQGEAR
jgi:Membrane-bound lysozyme-inhibitor of c-type lysozyme